MSLARDGQPSRITRLDQRRSCPDHQRHRRIRTGKPPCLTSDPLACAAACRSSRPAERFNIQWLSSYLHHAIAGAGLPGGRIGGNHRLGHARQRPGQDLHHAPERRGRLHVRGPPALPDGQGRRGPRDREVGGLQRARRRVPRLRPRPGPGREHRRPAPGLVQGPDDPGFRAGRPHRSRGRRLRDDRVPRRLRGREPDRRRRQPLRPARAVDGEPAASSPTRTRATAS